MAPGPLNKTVTAIASTAAVQSVQFTKQPDGTIQATSYGSVSLSDGGVDSEAERWTLGGAAETTVRNFMDGQALTRWRTAKGIEAP